MNFLSTYIPEKLIEALGWTLLHSLWQGVVAALVLGLLLLLLHRRSAAIRYLVSVMAMFTFSLVTVATFIKEYKQLSPTPASAANNMSYANGFPIELLASASEVQIQPESVWNINFPFASYFNQHLPLIVLLWALGIAILFIRFMGGLAYSQRLKSYKTVSLPENWQICLQDLSEKAHITQSVKMVESALVKIPMTIGYFKPVILLPLGTILGLPADQIEAILAHELAHISRKDYIVNICHCLIEILFFYHPAIWWMSARVREEREHCCDDMALSLCGDSLTFVKALASLENVYANTPALALSFAGKGNYLLRRIQRLIGEPRRNPNFLEGFIAACFLVVSLVAIQVSAGTTLQRIPDEVMDDFTINAQQQPIDENKTVQASDTTRNKDKGTFTYNGTKNGKKYAIKATIEGDKITKLHVNGKRIPQDEIANYQDLIYELTTDIPPPPVPMEAIALEVDEPAEIAEIPDVDLIEEVIEEEIVEEPELIEMEAIVALEPIDAIAPMKPFDLEDLLRDAFAGDTTTKRKGEFTYHSDNKDKNKSYKINIKGGVLTELLVNGKTIPKEEYKNYTYIINEIEEETHEHHIEAEVQAKEARARQAQARRKHEIAREQMMATPKIAARPSLRERNLDARKLEEKRIESELNRERALEERKLAWHEREIAREQQIKSLQSHEELIEVLENEFKKDNLVQEEHNYELKFNSFGLYIDGKKQSEPVFEKYKKLVEKQTGQDFSGFNIEYKISRNSK